MFVGGRNPTKKPAGRKESFPRDSRITSGLSRSKTSLSRPFRVLASGPIQAPSTGNRTSRHVPLLSRVFQLLRFFAHRMETSRKRCLNVWWRKKKMINSDNTKLEENFFSPRDIDRIFCFTGTTWRSFKVSKVSIQLILPARSMMCKNAQLKFWKSFVTYIKYNYFIK